MERIKYITDTCASDFKDMDGKILSMLDCIDTSWQVCDLIASDYGIMDIWEVEDEESCDIQEDDQYELTMCRTI